MLPCVAKLFMMINKNKGLLRAASKRDNTQEQAGHNSKHQAQGGSTSSEHQANWGSWTAADWHKHRKWERAQWHKIIKATVLTESSLGVWSRTMQGDVAPGLLRQPKFSFNINLTFGYLQSTQFTSATPPGDKQSPDQHSRIPKIPWEQPCGAVT